MELNDSVNETFSSNDANYEIVKQYLDRNNFTEDEIEVIQRLINVEKDENFIKFYEIYCNNPDDQEEIERIKYFIRKAIDRKINFLTVLTSYLKENYFFERYLKVELFIYYYNFLNDMKLDEDSFVIATLNLIRSISKVSSKENYDTEEILTKDIFKNLANENNLIELKDLELYLKFLNEGKNDPKNVFQSLDKENKGSITSENLFLLLASLNEFIYSDVNPDFSFDRQDKYDEIIDIIMKGKKSITEKEFMSRDKKNFKEISNLIQKAESHIKFLIDQQTQLKSTNIRSLLPNVDDLNQINEFTKLNESVAESVNTLDKFSTTSISKNERLKGFKNNAQRNLQNDLKDDLNLAPKVKILGRISEKASANEESKGEKHSRNSKGVINHTKGSSNTGLIQLNKAKETEESVMITRKSDKSLIDPQKIMEDINKQNAKKLSKYDFCTKIQELRCDTNLYDISISDFLLFLNENKKNKESFNKIQFINYVYNLIECYTFVFHSYQKKIHLDSLFTILLKEDESTIDFYEVIGSLIYLIDGISNEKLDLIKLLADNNKEIFIKLLSGFIRPLIKNFTNISSLIVSELLYEEYLENLNEDINDLLYKLAANDVSKHNLDLSSETIESKTVSYEFKETITNEVQQLNIIDAFESIWNGFKEFSDEIGLGTINVLKGLEIINEFALLDSFNKQNYLECIESLFKQSQTYKNKAFDLKKKTAKNKLFSLFEEYGTSLVSKAEIMCCLFPLFCGTDIEKIEGLFYIFDRNEAESLNIEDIYIFIQSTLKIVLRNNKIQNLNSNILTNSIKIEFTKVFEDQTEFTFTEVLRINNLICSN